MKIKKYLRKILLNNYLFPRKLRITREGKIIIAISFGIGMAALNSGNNLLFLIFGFLLTLIVVSGILSEINLKKIIAKRAGSESLWALTPARLWIEIESKKRKINSWTIEVGEIFEEEKIKQIHPSLLRIPPLSKKLCSMIVVFPKRGEYSSRGLKVQTKYPFSFFEKSIYYFDENKLIVYPQIVSNKELSSLTLGVGEEELSNRLGRGDEYYGVRKMQVGDDYRSIHWKISAKKRRKMVKEFQSPGERKFFIIIPNAVPLSEERKIQKIEKVISISASFSKFLIESQYSVGILTIDGFVDCKGGISHLHNILKFLALLPVHVMSEERVESKMREFLYSKRFLPSSSILIMPDFFNLRFSVAKTYFVD